MRTNRIVLLAIYTVLVSIQLFATDKDNWYPNALKAFESGDYATCQKLFHKYAPKSTGEYLARHDVNVVPWFESAIALNDWEDAVDAFTKWPSMPFCFYNGQIIDNKRYWITADGLKYWSSENAPIHNYIWTAMVHFYWDKLELFDNSPFVNNMQKLGKATLKDERTILGNSLYKVVTLYWENQLDYRITNVLKWLVNSAELGCANACIYLGNLYEKGGILKSDFLERESVNQDYSLAYNYWKKLAELNISVGFHKCGQYAQHGYGMEVNFKSAIDFYKKSVALNNSGNGIGNSSYCNLATCYEAVHDTISAFNTLKEAFENGFYDVSNNLGEYYKNGKIGKVDYAKAFETFSKGMTSGSYDYAKAWCKFQVGMMLHEGLGCNQNISESLKYLEASRNEGIIMASYALSQIYYSSADYIKSFSECNNVLATEDEIPRSVRASTCQLLAKMYSFGRGVEQNEKKLQNGGRKRQNMEILML